LRLNAISIIQKRTILKLLSRYSVEQLFALSTEELTAIRLSPAQINALRHPDQTLIEQSLKNYLL